MDILVREYPRRNKPVQQGVDERTKVLHHEHSVANAADADVMPSTATLNAADGQRLQTVLDAIAEPIPQRWAALDQLRYFCDGADAPLLEAIGGKRFSTLHTLLNLLDMATDLGGPVAVRTAPEHQRVPVGLVVALLECLLCNATSNLKPFLKTPNGVKNLVVTLSFYEELMYDAEFGPDILDRACNILCYCTFYHPVPATAIFTAAAGKNKIKSRILSALLSSPHSHPSHRRCGHHSHAQRGDDALHAHPRQTGHRPPLAPRATLRLVGTVGLFNWQHL